MYRPVTLDALQSLTDMTEEIACKYGGTFIDIIKSVCENLIIDGEVGLMQVCLLTLILLNKYVY